MLSNDTQEEIREFAEKITPENWRIILHPFDAQYKPGVFNLFIRIGGEDEDMPQEREEEYENLEEEKRPCPGGVTGGLLFSDLRERGLEEGRVSQAVIQIWPYTGDWRLRIVRELARLATYRRKAMRLKAHRSEETVIVRPEFPGEELEDPAFSSAYSLLLKRTEETFGHKV